MIIVLDQQWSAGDFAVHTFDLNTAGSPDANYPLVWAANDAYVISGMLDAAVEDSTHGLRFAGVSFRNFSGGGAVVGGPSTGGRVTVRLRFDTEGFENGISTFPGYFVIPINVYGGGTALNGPEVPGNLAFQVQFYYLNATTVAVDLLYSDVVSGSGSIFGGAFDITASGYTVPRATLEGNTFDLELEWCNSSATHDEVTAWMTVGGSPAPASDGYVTLTFGGAAIYALTDKPIVTFWQPSEPTRFNQWNKLAVGMSGLPGPVDYVQAWSLDCLTDTPGVDSSVINLATANCCTTPTTGQVAAPVGPAPAPTYSCTGGGLVEELADLPGLAGCWL